MSNFYEILGVSKNSDLAEIKRAYKQLAKQYHPDKNKSAEASEKFKEISVAYETLKDAEKREEYDLQLRFGGRSPGNGFNHSTTQHHYSAGSSFDDLFNEILRQRKERESRERSQNEDINDILRNKREGWGRGNRESKMDFSSEGLFREPDFDLFGNKRSEENVYAAIPSVTFDLTLDECINGTVRHFLNKDTGKEIKINIPARVTPEDILKIKSPRVDIHIKPKFRKFKFKDGDVYLNVPIDKFKDTEFVEIETIMGEKIKLKTPPENEIYKGKKLRLKGKGWLNRSDERTNMYITIS